MTTTRLDYTHDITLITKKQTRKGDPMWVCETKQGDTMYIFGNQIQFWDNGWTIPLAEMAEGESLRWETFPMRVNAELDGKYWQIYDVAPMSKDAQPDTVPVPKLALYADYIKSRIELWQREPIAIFDTETTGLDVQTDEIVSIACTDWSETLLFNEYEKGYTNLFVQPEHPEKLMIKGKGGKSPYDIHGIDPKRVSACPKFPDVYAMIYEAMAHTHWICWNAPYDAPLLDNLCIRHKLPLIPRLSVTCAMRLTAPVFGEWNESKGQFAWQKLENAATHYGIDAQDTHNAYADVLMTRAVLEAVLEELS